MGKEHAFKHYLPYRWKKSLSRVAGGNNSVGWSRHHRTKNRKIQDPGCSFDFNIFSFVVLSLAVWFWSALTTDEWSEHACGHVLIRVDKQAANSGAQGQSWFAGQIPRANSYMRQFLKLRLSATIKWKFARPLEFFAFNTSLRVLYHVEATNRLSRPALYVHRHLYNVLRVLILLGRRVDYHPQHSEFGYHLPLW